MDLIMSNRFLLTLEGRYAFSDCYLVSSYLRSASSAAILPERENSIPPEQKRPETRLQFEHQLLVSDFSCNFFTSWAFQAIKYRIDQSCAFWLRRDSSYPCGYSRIVLGQRWPPKDIHFHVDAKAKRWDEQHKWERIWDWSGVAELRSQPASTSRDLNFGLAA